MDYHEAAEFLFDLRRFQVRPGTGAVRALLRELGDPHGDVTFVQVAGSNGKGSTARMVESCLRESGHRVGLYTSPHLDDLRERVRVDGRKVPRAAVATFVERAASGEPLTFFEAVTALALWRFGEADCDIAVLEAGLGGRYDATSVVDPAASAVTNVALEHTDILGETVPEIAARHAAVAPADRPLVTGAEGEALDALREAAGDLLRVGGDDPDADVRATDEGHDAVETRVSLAGEGWDLTTSVPLPGAHQARNAGVAVALVRAVADARGETPPDAPALARGLRRANWPGRFEAIARDPLVVLDGAHNPAACATTAGTLDAVEYDRLHVVFAAMHDKDHRGMVRALPTPDAAWTCEPTIERAEDHEVLAAVWASAGVDATPAGGVADALRAAESAADPDDCVLVVGSLFAAGEARRTRTRTARPVRVAASGDAAAALSRAGVADGELDRLRDRAVHRSVVLRAERGRAERLRAAMLDCGGMAAVRAGEATGEPVEVVLAGTLDAFGAFVGRIADEPGLGGAATEVRRTVDGLAAGRPRHGYPWEERPSVMGILNVTPDSFHDGGEFLDPSDAAARAEAMVAAGADIVDVGGESTRPGAEPVPAETELERVLPVVEAVADTDALVSIDTRKAGVGRAALDAGADVLNDVTGLEDPEMRFLAAERDVPVVVMHSIDAPVVPGKEVPYDDVVTDVIDALRERVLLAEKAGVAREKVIVDPGLGFGKTAAEDFTLLGRLDELRALGCPVLVGHSHKSMFAQVDREADERGAATVAATAVAVDRGADIVRVHDVPENVAAVRTALAADGEF